MKKLRILIIDDSVVYRKLISDALCDVSCAEVVGTAPNGKIGLDKIDNLKPDVITLDVEMPEMDGYKTLQRLKEQKSDCDVIMVSSVNPDSAQATIKSLALGAFDFIAKPDDSNREENAKEIKRQIQRILSAIATKRMLRRAKTESGATKLPQPVRKRELNSAFVSKPEIVAIGISTGGPEALSNVVPMLPGNLGIPVVIVQHMPSNFTASLAELLNKKSKINVVEAVNNQPLKPGTVYIAPGGKHMKVVSFNSQEMIMITGDPPENNCRPAVDYLFRSVAKLYKKQVLAIIMTGMGSDGTLGLRLIKRHAARVIAQSEETCVIFGMPGEAVKAGVVDEVVPLSQIADEIKKAGS